MIDASKDRTNVKLLLSARRREVHDDVHAPRRSGRLWARRRRRLDHADARTRGDMDLALIQMRSDTLTRIDAALVGSMPASMDPASSAATESPSGGCRPCRSRSAAAIAKTGVSRSTASRRACRCLGGPIRRRCSSVVQNDTQERAIDGDRQLTVVLDEAELLELVEEEVHPGARRADHLRERLL